MTLPRLLLFAALLGPLVAFAPRRAAPPQVQATLVSADTGGVFWARGADTLRVTNSTWTRADSAPAAPDCVYSGRSRRMTARDSMRVTISAATFTWSLILRPSDELRPAKAPTRLPSGRTFTLLDVSAPTSPCGVNAGQVWFHWSIDR